MLTPDARRFGAFLALALGLGAVAGLVWWWVTDLPTFRVVNGGGAVTSERGLAGYIAADAWFVVCGVVVGLVLGVLAWRWFGRAGWLVVLVAVVVVVVAAGVTAAVLLSRGGAGGGTAEAVAGRTSAPPWAAPADVGR